MTALDTEERFDVGLVAEALEDVEPMIMRYWFARHREHGRLRAMMMEPDSDYLAEVSSEITKAVIRAGGKRDVFQMRRVIFAVLAFEHIARTSDFNRPKGTRPPKKEHCFQVIEGRAA